MKWTADTIKNSSEQLKHSGRMLLSAMSNRSCKCDDELRRRRPTPMAVKAPKFRGVRPVAPVTPVRGFNFVCPWNSTYGGTVASFALAVDEKRVIHCHRFCPG